MIKRFSEEKKKTKDNVNKEIVENYKKKLKSLDSQIDSVREQQCIINEIQSNLELLNKKVISCIELIDASAQGVNASSIVDMLLFRNKMISEQTYGSVQSDRENIANKLKDLDEKYETVCREMKEQVKKEESNE